MFHTVKEFGIVNKAEIDVFLELSCIFHDPADVGNSISGSSAFSKTILNIWKFTVALRHILIKLTKIKHKEQILKAAREKKITHKEIPIIITADLSIENLQARREWKDIFIVMKEKTYNLDYCTQQGSHSNMKEKSKALQTRKAERIQHHQTSSPTNAKGSSVDRKHKKGV